MTRAVLTVIAGANGAGKSTLTSGNPDFFSNIPLLDPDAIVQTLQPEVKAASVLAAGRQVLEQAAQHLAARSSFAVETTLSGKNYLRMMDKAHAHGYEVVLIYIGTEDVEINLQRIAHRVSNGGHFVPPEDVRRRYERSFRQLPLAIEKSDRAILFDNTTEAGYQLVGVLENKTWEWLLPNPNWVQKIFS